MPEKPSRKAWGSGRIAFLAQLPDIKRDLAAGIPMTAIYARHQHFDVTYRSFCRLVARYAHDAKPVFHQTTPPDPVRRSVRSAPATPPPAAPPPLSPDRIPQGTTDATSPVKTFRHAERHVEKPGDRARLFDEK